MMLQRTVCILLLSKLSAVQMEITDQDYAEMPPLFFMDNYDHCMLLKHPLYCSFVYELQPISSNSSKIWNTIKEISSDEENYRHDRLRHWICVPETCPDATEDGSDLEESLRKCYDAKFSHMDLRGTISRLKCKTSLPLYFIDTYDVVVGIILLSYVTWVIFASFYEGLARYKSKDVYEEVTTTKIGKIISAFSLPKNWYRLTAPNTNPEFEKLRCIQGMRFYNMICVIMSHTVLTYLAGPVNNPKYVETMNQKLLNMFLSNGSYAVQTFFLISGWLLSYHFFQMFEGRKKVKFKYVALAFLNRYFRLTPTLAVVLAIHSTWMVHFSDGPQWDDLVGDDYRNCRENWWTNLLYVNNYVNANKMCMLQTWYIASDTQLFILSLILLVIMWRNQQWIKWILGTSLIIGVVVPGIVSYVYDFDIIIRQYPELVYGLEALKIKIWIVMNAAGYNNIGGYMIGVTFGYIHYKYKDINLASNKIIVVLWWFLTFGLCIFIILIARIMYQKDFVQSRLAAAIYWSLGKNLFAFGIAVAIFGMTHNIGYFVKWFCEWRAVQVFGRLTYSAYLIHVLFARVRAGYLRYPALLDDFLIFHTTLGDVTLGYLAATLLTLIVELPISALQKLWVPQLKTKRLTEKIYQTAKWEENSENISTKI